VFQLILEVVLVFTQFLLGNVEFIVLISMWYGSKAAIIIILSCLKAMVVS